MTCGMEERREPSDAPSFPHMALASSIPMVDPSPRPPELLNFVVPSIATMEASHQVAFTPGLSMTSHPASLDSPAPSAKSPVVIPNSQLSGEVSGSKEGLQCVKAPRRSMKCIRARRLDELPRILGETLVGRFCGKSVTIITLKFWMAPNCNLLLSYMP